jgi:uncharacterized membrane protein YgdD (TMEM256/DUF423 family)
MSRFFLLSGLLLMILAVALGAFGAHALKTVLEPTQMKTWHTASEYHFIHALGLILLGIQYANKGLNTWVKSAGLFLFTGVLLFSGSLYLLATTGQTALGMITPVGGLCFILGWAAWFVAALKSPDKQGTPG